MESTNPPEKLHVFVELQESALVLELRERLKETQESLERLEKAHKSLEFRYANEVHINNELIDLCRKKGVKYRKALDSSTWNR